MTRWRALAAGLLVTAALATAAPAQEAANNPPPPTPWVVPNACPGEDCHLGEWAACEPTPVLKYRQARSPVAFAIQQGERVTAVEGVVEVSQPGMLVFRDTITYVPPQWAATRDTIRASPRDTFYLLNTLPQGQVVWWLHARADTGIMHWWESPEPRVPPRGIMVRSTRAVWWVAVENAAGQRGWVRPTYQTMSGVSPRLHDGVERCARKR